MDNKENISRRDFAKGAILAVASIPMISTVYGCSSNSSTPTITQSKSSASKTSTNTSSNTTGNTSSTKSSSSSTTGNTSSTNTGNTSSSKKDEAKCPICGKSTTKSQLNWQGMCKSCYNDYKKLQELQGNKR